MQGTTPSGEKTSEFPFLGIEVDTHTHSILSGHAFSTVKELAIAAKEIGLKGFVLTDHGPLFRGAQADYYYTGLHRFEDHLEGVRFYKGVEISIIDDMGKMELSDHDLRHLEYVIASLHSPVLKPSSKASNTRALIAAAKNEFIDTLGHPGNPAYDINIPDVVKACADYGTMIEINNNSFLVRKGSEKNCAEFIEQSLLRGVMLSIASDCHIYTHIGRVDDAVALAIKCGVKEENVINSRYDRINAFISEKIAFKANYL